MASKALRNKCNKSLLKRTRLTSIVFGLHTTSYNKKSYDFLHKSILSTDCFQKSLPRLPIPKLENSCQRYLEALKPILSEAEYNHSKVIVSEFLKVQGPGLQSQLLTDNKKNKHTSYVSAAWFDMYLKDRRSIVLNYNPFMQFADDSRPEYMNQLIRATNMVVSSVRFVNTYRANVLEPDIYHLHPHDSDNIKFRKFIKMIPKSLAWYGAYWYKAFPLDMSQYINLFNSTRIPRLGKDELFSDCSARHLLVIRNGNHYYFDVIDKEGKMVAANRIMANLKYIMAQNIERPMHSIGFLTAENRDIWANMRDKLHTLGNSASLYMMDSALFALVLEDSHDTNPNNFTKLFLYGDGANRWFDKSFSLILDKEGIGAVNFEHSWGDGVAVLRYFNEVFKDSTERPAVHPNHQHLQIDCSKDVKRIEWKLDDEVRGAIDKAKENFKSETSKLDNQYVQFKSFGKDYLKHQHISPDSFMQLAFQMAYYKLFGKVPATYESCSTAAFKHGRTETIRSATVATKHVCDLFASTTASQTERKEAILQATHVHNNLTKEAAMGQGFDRHLLCLKLLATERKIDCPIFLDKSYGLLNHIILSTSTLSSPALKFGGFAPVSFDGYGIGYAAEANFLGANVTTYKPHKDVGLFLNSLEMSLNEMYQVLEATKST